MAGLEKRLPSQLSGGQQRRVALARARGDPGTIYSIRRAKKQVVVSRLKKK